MTVKELEATILRNLQVQHDTWFHDVDRSDVYSVSQDEDDPRYVYLDGTFDLHALAVEINKGLK